MITQSFLFGQSTWSNTFVPTGAVPAMKSEATAIFVPERSVLNENVNKISKGNH